MENTKEHQRRCCMTHGYLTTKPHHQNTLTNHDQPTSNGDRIRSTNPFYYFMLCPAHMVFYLKYTVDECLLLLVNSMHIFWSNSISKQGLTDVCKMLKYFVLMIKELYHPCYCKCNVHSLLHHVDFVEDHGLLFLFSFFR